MYRSAHARELDTLLRLSRELDVVGDVTATVAHPSELIAWAGVLADPNIVGWRSKDSGFRYIQASADHPRAPVRGRVAAVLPCDGHLEFWNALGLGPIQHGTMRGLTLAELSAAWTAMPVAALGHDTPVPSPPRPDSKVLESDSE